MKEELIRDVMENEEIKYYLLATDEYFMGSGMNKVELMSLLTSLLANLLENDRITEKELDRMVEVSKKIKDGGVAELLKEKLYKMKNSLED